MLRILRYFILALFLIAIFLTFKKFDQPLFRYVNDTCQRKLIFERTDDIDFLFLGGSRVMKSVRTDAFSKALSNQNKTIIAYDLARSWRSELHSYIFLRDLYDQGRDVKNVVMLFYAANDFRYHPHAHIIGKSSDILDLIVSSESVPWTEKVQDNLSLNIKRATYHLQSWIQGTLYKEPNEVKEMSKEVTDCTFKETPVKPIDMLEKDEMQDETDVANKMEWDFKDPRNARVTRYVQKVIELASRHNTKVYLLLPIPFLKKPLSQEFIQEVEKTFGVPFLSPNQTTLNVFGVAKYYGDESHMTPEGAILFSEWLAGEIKKHE